MNAETRKLRILLIGPLPIADDVLGGAKISFSKLASQLSWRNFDLEVVNTSRSRTYVSRWAASRNNLTALLKVVWTVLKRIWEADLVFVNMSVYSALWLAAPVWIISKVARRPMALRFFGAGLNQIYQEYSPIARWLADRTFMQSSIVYVQSQQLCDDFANRPNFRWFPNARNITVTGADRRPTPQKVLFLSRLRKDKGLGEALAACRYLPEGCLLQVFGEPVPDTDFSLFDGHPRATYGGVLRPEDVPQALCENDLLLFPSYYEGEGYPGVLIEAFQCGLPVIATRWRAIPEVVTHEENGLLVEPRSAADLRAAIERLLENPDLYRRLCEGAQRRGEYFRSGPWYDRMASDLEDLVLTANERGRPTGGPREAWKSSP